VTDGLLVRVLGPVRFPGRDGALTEPGGAMPRRLLVALALAGAEGRSVGGLSDDLWTDGPPRNPRGALQMLVSRIRATAAEGLLESTASGYRLSGTDLWSAEAAAAAGAEHALALWTGVPGADLDDDLMVALGARAGRARARLLSLRAAALLAEGRDGEAVPLLDELVRTQPLDGGPVGRLMRALAATGRVDAALGAFADHRERLADALGADPDPDLVRLNTELLRGRTDPESAELVGVRSGTTALLGREDDLARLLATVPAHRLTSIIGTGGLGKTRLAHEAALGLADRFERIVFTELVGAQAAADVELVVAAAVGARAVGRARRLNDPLPADLPTRTREVLASRRTLLVLDNCEHVVDVVAALTDDLLATVPTLTVLTTSRVPLLVPGEAVVAPQPLPPAAAGSALFVARATAARPGVALDPALVERVCARLDGLPLAIELAAARLRSMTLPELDRRLADRFAVLVGGDRTAPDRHRTLLAVIEWSRRLLSPAAAEALAALAVFPDGFTEESAGRLLGRDASAVLTELVDQSLLGFAERGAARGRYRMLETVREYGLRDLAERGRLDAAHAALDEWALRFARRVSPGLLAGTDPAATRVVAEEEETLLAVLRTGDDRRVVGAAVASLLAEFWIYRGEFESILGVLPSLLAAGARAPVRAEQAEEAERTQEAIRALTLAVAIAMIVSRPEVTRAFALLRRVLRTAGEPSGFWAVLADGLLLSPDIESGVVVLDRLTAHTDPLIASFALLMRAQLEENSGATSAAVVDLTAGEALAARHGYSWFRFLARTNLVSLRSQRGEHLRALAEARRAREEILELEVDADLRQLDWLIGANAIVAGELDEAERILTALTALRGRGGVEDERDNRAFALAGLAEVATARGDHEAALRRWREATDTTGRTASPWRVVVEAASLAGRVALDVPTAELDRQYGRLRVLLIVLMRLQGDRFDAPVLGSGMVGLATVLRRTDPTTAEELIGVGLALGARRDLASIDAAVRGTVPAPVDGPTAARRAMELLRSSAVRRW
jgi:predicted ATPase/DNA-binding SARP family transcriptional activator